MSEREFAVWLLTRGLAMAVALYALHRLALALEESVGLQLVGRYKERCSHHGFEDLVYRESFVAA